MDNKLQELTDRLYNEGLAKGKQEAEELLAKAKAEAEKIVSDAKSEAEAIVSKAEKDAAAKAVKTDAEIKMAAKETLDQTKAAIEKVIIASAAVAPAKAALKDEQFVKEVILAVAKNSNEGADVEVVLPENVKESLGVYVENEVAKALKGNVSVKFSKKIAGGFTIGPKNGGYYLSFTDETFAELISQYIREETKNLIFG
ncbi:MAG: hypothetical protein HUJ95_05245 [Bacteroidales bacterium]|nr:hypothetical protein [Bacteroidales bacterium]